MSLILKYVSGSTYTLVADVVSQEYGQELAYAYHIPFSDVSIAAGNGLSLSKITIAGSVASKTAVDWRHVSGVSFDSGTSYQTVVFSSVDWQDDRWSSIYPFTLTLVAYVQRVGSSTRYPTSGYQWGAGSVSLLAHGGNANASPKITLLPPLLHFPLSQNLASYEGSGIVFTRAGTKTHLGIAYGVNAPIYDNGLYLASDTSSDVGVMTLTASTLKTIAMQIKQTRYPSPWVIGAGAGTANLLTANQSNAETDTTGMGCSGGTLTRNTVTPLAGTADFKAVATGGNLYINCSTRPSVTAGLWYCAQALVRTSGCAAGRKVSLALEWRDAAGVLISGTANAPQIDCPTTATLVSVIGRAPQGAVTCLIYAYIPNCVAGETLYVDSLMLEVLPTSVTIWTAAKNKLTIDLVNNLLQWTDDTTTVSAAFPTAYMAGTVTDVVVMEAAAHAVTVIAHAAGGAWASQTGTLAAIAWPALTLGVLEGSLANLTEYDYVLTSAEYQALAYSLAPWSFNTLRIPLRYPGTTVKDGQTLAIAGADHSGLLGGSDVAVGASNVTLTESGGIACRWFAELARTDTP